MSHPSQSLAIRLLARVSGAAAILVAVVGLLDLIFWRLGTAPLVTLPQTLLFFARTAGWLAGADASLANAVSLSIGTTSRGFGTSRTWLIRCGRSSVWSPFFAGVP